jgi:uncharacterized protein (TIGR02118 family)
MSSRSLSAHGRETVAAVGQDDPGPAFLRSERKPVATPQGPSPYHLIATLTFDSMEAIGAAFASSQGQATAADVATFAQAGVQMLMFDTRAV